MTNRLLRFAVVVSLLCAVPGIGLAASDQFSTPRSVPQSAAKSGPLSDAELHQLIKDLTPPSKIVLPSTPAPPSASPVTTFGTPTAYGANWGQAFIGVGGTHYLNNDTEVPDTDGSMSLGMGFGNAETLVGIEAYVNIISIRSDFGDSGSVGAKIHKIIPGTDGLGVAVGWDNAATWGDADDAEDTAFAVVSKSFNLRPANPNPLPLSVSLGAGTGTFRTKDDLDEVNSDNDLNVFGSLGLTITPQFSLATSWTGSQLNAGIGLVPFASVPLSLSAGVGDITEEFDAGATLMMSAGYSFSF